MKTAIIIHGMPSKEEYFDSTSDSPSNVHWIPWLQKQLLVKNILAQTPEMPEPYLPDYEKWKNIFEQFKIDEETILVGHSCGAGFILRYLSENDVKVGKVALVAPWINPEDDELGRKMFDDLSIDEDLLIKVKDLKIFVSNDDDDFILDGVAILRDRINSIKIIDFENRGHFDELSKTEKFPELLEFLIS